LAIELGYRGEFPVCDLVALVADSESEPAVDCKLVMVPAIDLDAFPFRRGPWGQARRQ